MVFSSVAFLGLFLPFTILLYFIRKNRSWRNSILLIVSLLFYAWGEPVNILVMIGITLIDYVFGMIFNKIEKKRTKKLLITLCIVLNLLPLVVFKYYNFLIYDTGKALGLSLPFLHAMMPIGISFFTFQSMSYAIDVYRGKAEIQKTYFNVLLYVAMFPQLIAGPIVRYADIAQEINHRIETPEGFAEGSFRFAVGLGKKIIFADYAGKVAAYLLYSRLETLTVSAAWIGLLFAMLQLYFDFSGYSDMAIGLGNIFGFHFKENFRYPFIANSVTDFWRRWHISMGSWFRDYVYIPLGGNRVKLGRWLINIFVVWMVTGIWHGADWNFIGWGLVNGIFLVIEKFLHQKNIHIDRIPILSHVGTFVLVSLALVMFFFTLPSDIATFYSRLFGVGGYGIPMNFYELSAFNEVFRLLPLMLVGATPLPAYLAKRVFIEGNTAYGIARIVWSIFLIALSYILILNQSFKVFLYFRF